MPELSAYADVVTRFRDVHLLSSAASLLSWDQETMMPDGGVEHRARELALLARISHERLIAPTTGDLLGRCESESADPDSDVAVNLREFRREYAHATRVPADLVGELAETQSLAQHAWTSARKTSDFAAFAPWLEKMMTFLRRKAECLGVPEGGELWDALADRYEPDVRAQDLQEMFTPLAAHLGSFVHELQASGRRPDDAFIRVCTPQDQQERFVRHVATAIGFDFDRGRLDLATHPFCSGSHPGDVRITTRFHDDNLIDALGSTMHEAGHGIYEQGLQSNHWGTPRGAYVSLGIHESQSRLWENQVGRSRAFWHWCQPQLRAYFGSSFDAFSAEDCYAAANLVAPSLIRVEADEATYNLHVLIRFELELALMRDELAVVDLPQAWNEGYKKHLGVTVPDDARGCLQDVHWSCGLFGYFPTYTLGNLYAAQIYGAAEIAIPDLDAQLQSGQFDALRTWLNTNVHAHGKRFSAARLCELATGRPLETAPFLDYLAAKLRPLY